MCLAVPLRITQIKDNGQALGEYQGAEVEFSTLLLDDPRIGSYVLVHAGTALEVLDEQEALETIALLEEMAGNGPD